MQAYGEGCQKGHHLCQQVGRLILARHVMGQDDSATHQFADVVMLKLMCLVREDACQLAAIDWAAVLSTKMRVGAKRVYSDQGV